MHVSIVPFPETRVAMISHIGPPWTEHDTVRKLVAWKLRHGMLDQEKYRHYGLHRTDARLVPPSEHRVDFCLSYDGPVEENAFGIFEAVIPAARCALARDIGSRTDNQAARYLVEEWLPASGETMGGPMIFHYVNVGPQVAAHEAITDVYLPLSLPA
jgi:AraC family transcriptional regulator